MAFLELDSVEVGFSEPLISEINANLSLGEVCLLIGNNGTGKTSLMKTILGLSLTRKGSVWVQGESIKNLKSSDIAKRISVVFSKSHLPINYTLVDLLSMGKYIHHPYYFKLDIQDIEEIERVIQMLNLDKYRKYPLNKLSDGNLQKAFIGRALVQDSPMIILDEPTTYLDEETKIMILDLLRSLAKEQNKAILFSSHDWRLAGHFADQIWLIKDKKMEVVKLDQKNILEDLNTFSLQEEWLHKIKKMNNFIPEN